MKCYIEPNKEDWKRILQRPVKERADLEAVVEKVFSAVRENRDGALKKYTQEFDKVSLDTLSVSEEEFAESDTLVSDELKNAIKLAAKNITRFHENQQFEEGVVETQKGVSCWRKSVAIDSVGLYVPGGTAPLFSTVLMLGIPAKIANCKNIVLCTPPNSEGKVHPAILFTAKLIGIQKVIKVGGIQGIAAMTFGTESVPSVNKIFGPGNQYVTTAKERATKEGVAIDMPAGPSEVLVYSDESGNADFIAADLLSQAEHGADSQVVFVSKSEQLVKEVENSLADQLPKLPRASIAEKALENSVALVIPEESKAIEIINEYGPEHFILMSENEDLFLNQIVNAGSVFIGLYTPESAGDYASGTNHTLPTNGAAKAYSGVSLDSFTKRITYQRIDAAGIQSIGPSIEVMAENELLDAHKNAVTLRLKNLAGN